MAVRPPSLFVSHGAPSFALEDGPAHRFLRDFGLGGAAPKAIVVVSAHHLAADGPVVGAAPAPETVHDFGGFGPALEAIRYPARGDADMSDRVMTLLAEAGFRPQKAERQGLDHGAWVPLSLMAPRGEVPVIPVSIDPRRGAQRHLALGRALAPLRDEGVMIIGSGGVTHNLQAFIVGGYAHDAAPPDWVRVFRDWLHRSVTDGRWDDVVHALERGPQGRRNHPHPDHFLPFIVALGAGGPNPKAERLHASETYGVLAMDVYAFH